MGWGGGASLQGWSWRGGWAGTEAKGATVALSAQPPCVAGAAVALMQSDRDRCDISVPTHFHTTSHRLGVTHAPPPAPPLPRSCPPAAGQHDDARVNLAAALTAARYGAATANYTRVVHLHGGGRSLGRRSRRRWAEGGGREGVLRRRTAGKSNPNLLPCVLFLSLLPSLLIPDLTTGAFLALPDRRRFAHLMQVCVCVGGCFLIFYKRFTARWAGLRSCGADVRRN